jgi:dCTP deaminase
MSFWTTEKILQKQTLAKMIMPFHVERLKHGAYELSLGSELLVTSEPAGVKRKIEDGEQISIPPGQFGLLLTEEIISIPDNAIGFISIPFSIKCQGLVNVSGFHVDPGFVGHLKFAVYNAGSQNVFLSRGERAFMIWFSDLSETTKDVYDGGHCNQNGITDADARFLHGEVASPAALKKQIEEVQSCVEQGLATLSDQHKQQVAALEDKTEQRIKTLDDKIAIWRTFTITFFSAITVLILGTILSLVLGLFTKLFPPAPAASPNTTNQTSQSQNSNGNSNAERSSSNRSANSNGAQNDGRPTNRAPRR